MRNWKCRLGIHVYKTICIQKVSNVVGGFSMTSLTREVRQCKQCGKVHFIGYDISTIAHLDDTLDWKPKFNKQ